MGILRWLRQIRHGVSYVNALLQDPVGPANVAEARARVARRAQVLLDMVERAIFAIPDSPYRPLLEPAGYDLARIRAMVDTGGVEATLEALHRGGVYVSIEEFKGMREALRGDRVFRFDERAFRNPLGQEGLLAWSGGTGGRSIPTPISLANLRRGTEHLALALTAYGLEGRPVVVWMSHYHGASLWAVLALAAMGNTPPAWFTQWTSRSGLDLTAVYYRAIQMAARRHGVALPPLTQVPVGEEHRIVTWLGGGLPRGGCGIITTPSSALRLVLAAKEAGTDLPHVAFITIGEPLTPAKLRAIHAVGARAFSSLGFTEFGRATYGCAHPQAPDDTHVCLDAIAVVTRRRPVDRLGAEVDALLFTSLRPDARRILLNVETGDYAGIHSRPCGCLLEQAGWMTHLFNVRSFEKLNAEGRLFFGSHLITLVEEALPQQFGGAPTDYQLVEQEDRNGFTRLTVLIHPRLGPVDEEAVLACVERTLRGADDTATSIWKEMGTVQVHRDAPRMTAAGKLVPLRHLGPQDTDLQGA
ncbi:MAG: hypothetical protein HY355_04510 [Armatimonadetes bacterium]|nr:hypothetical protein [Armatimonadota bacterium]